MSFVNSFPLQCCIFLILYSWVSVQCFKLDRFLSTRSRLEATTVNPEGHSDYYSDRFKNVQSLYGNESSERLKHSHVCVIGLGGVGSWAAEALARSGVMSFTIIDIDDICISNINRQIYTSNHVGKLKAEVLRDKIFEINPESSVNVHLDFVRKDNVDKYIDTLHGYNVVLECADSVSDKAAILDACVRKRIPVITTGGVGGLIDPTLLRISDLTKAEGDNLLKHVRKMLRQNYGYPKVPEGKKGTKSPRKKSWNIASVHTLPTGVTRGIPMCDTSATEVSVSSLSSEEKDGGEISASPGQGGFRVCDTKLGNACFTTGTAGFIMASLTIKMIASGEYSYPRVEIVENEKTRSYKEKKERGDSHVSEDRIDDDDNSTSKIDIFAEF